MTEPKARKSLKEHLHVIIFEADTSAGKTFDIALLVLIIISVLAVMLETVKSVNRAWSDALIMLEWITTAIFTVEYMLRIYAAPDRKAYIFSFYGLIDLLTIVPSYFALIFTGSDLSADGLSAIFPKEKASVVWRPSRCEKRQDFYHPKIGMLDLWLLGHGKSLFGIC